MSFADPIPEHVLRTRDSPVVLRHTDEHEGV
jgi:hypothetical protein